MDTPQENKSALPIDLTKNSYCHCHDTYEPIPENVYRICYECGHVYTAQELQRRYREEMVRIREEAEAGDMRRYGKIRLRYKIPAEYPVETIYFCQECLHDF